MSKPSDGPARLYVTSHPRTPFQVVYRDPTRRAASGRARRIPKWFAKQEDAEKYRDELNERLLTDGAVGVGFDAALRGDAIAARKWLDQHGHTHVSLLHVAQSHVTSAPSATAAGPIGEDVRAFLLEKEVAEGCSAATIQNLETRVWGWVNREGITSADDVRRERVESLRLREGVSANSRKNDMAAVSSFCTWLLEKKKIPHHPLKGIRRPKIPPGTKPVWSPEECQRVLWAAMSYLGGKWLGTMAALILVGPRPSELSETRFAYGRQPVARIEGGKLRGRANRMVPLSPAARAWLKAADNPTQVAPINAKARSRIMAMAKVKFTADVPRHTFISYRMAEIKDAGETAIEAGTSESVIFRHYNKPRLAADVRKWLALRPAA